MATTETVTVHPGDILQDTNGLFYLAASTHSWGVGAVLRWAEGGELRESYHRLRPGQFVVVGTAHTLPEEVSQARRDSLQTARTLAREALADPDDLTPQWDVEVRFNGRTTGAGQLHPPGHAGPARDRRATRPEGRAVSPSMDPAQRGYHAVYRENEPNYCPGCGRGQWIVGRVTAECAFCATALPLEGQRPATQATVIGFSTRPGTGPLE